MKELLEKYYWWCYDNQDKLSDGFIWAIDLTPFPSTEKNKLYNYFSDEVWDDPDINMILDGQDLRAGFEYIKDCIKHIV